METLHQSAADAWCTGLDFSDVSTRGLELSSARRAYVLSHLERAGWIIGDLGENQLLTVFALLSRYEEHGTETRHNGHNWELSFAQLRRGELGSIPIVERLLHLWETQGLVQRQWQHAARWPNDSPFCLCLTHDVDQLQEYLWLERLRSLRYHRDAPSWARAVLAGSIAKEILRRVKRFRRVPTPPLEAWLEVEDRFGFQSTFHFFADPVQRPCWEDVFYRHDDRIDFEGRRCCIGDVINTIASRGWDVGLHGSCAAHACPDLLRGEKEALERVAGAEVTSTRQHHLMCDVRTTPRAHADAGLRTDSTFGSNVSTEFRCGTCLPFYLFDLERDRPLPVLEIPLTIQDIPLCENAAGSEELMYRRCIELMDRVADVGGVLTLLWHNHHRVKSAEFRCYERVLTEAASRGAWGCSMRQLDRWWRADQ